VGGGFGPVAYHLVFMDNGYQSTENVRHQNDAREFVDHMERIFRYQTFIQQEILAELATIRWMVGCFIITFFGMMFIHAWKVEGK
jgi:hypothetical protein